MIEVSIQNKDPVIDIDSDIIPSRPSISITGIPGGVCKCKITNHDTDYWNNNPLYIPKLNEIIVYSDYTKNGDTDVPAIKIGDGKAYVIDLPFVDNGTAQKLNKLIDDFNSHIMNDSIHVSQEDRDFWNDKLNLSFSDEILTFNRQ